MSARLLRAFTCLGTPPTSSQYAAAARSISPRSLASRAATYKGSSATGVGAGAGGGAAGAAGSDAAVEGGGGGGGGGAGGGPGGAPPLRPAGGFPAPGRACRSGDSGRRRGR